MVVQNEIRRLDSVQKLEKRNGRVNSSQKTPENSCQRASAFIFSGEMIEKLQLLCLNKNDTAFVLESSDLF
ncbi:MAG: hypothetical protein ACOX60_04430 [Massiliimalia sp.]|jgi:cytoplasmic iron level regulating protein YaaA (DUF328/UPF0246 family)